MSVKFDFKTLKTGFEADWPVTVNVPQDGGTVEKQESSSHRPLSTVHRPPPQSSWQPSFPQRGAFLHDRVAS